MTKYDLRDTSFLIYARIDSDDRIMNLELVIGHIQSYFDTNIALWEMDTESRIPKRIKESEGISYRFLDDADPILHTTRYRNAMVRQCGTPYFFVCDADVIVAPEALAQCTRYLRNAGERTLAYPYNGDFYDVSKDIKDVYVKSRDYGFLKTKKEKFRLWFRYSTGGIFGGRTGDFEESGPDNENICGWGPDDKERYYRLKKVGFTIKRTDTPLYHLHHERKVNSWHANGSLKTRNQQEFLRVLKGISG